MKHEFINDTDLDDYEYQQNESYRIEQPRRIFFNRYLELLYEDGYEYDY